MPTGLTSDAVFSDALFQREAGFITETRVRLVEGRNISVEFIGNRAFAPHWYSRLGVSLVCLTYGKETNVDAEIVRTEAEFGRLRLTLRLSRENAKMITTQGDQIANVQRVVLMDGPSLSSHLNRFFDAARLGRR